MSKPTLCVFVGDLHCGGDTAIAPDGFTLKSKDDKPLALSAAQAALLISWVDMVERVKAEAKRHSLALMLGGDLIDGPAHHGTHQTTGTASEMRLMAEELLRPLADVATSIYSVDGTDAHVGIEAEHDRSVSTALGAAYRPYWRMHIGGRWLDWRHGGINISQRPHLEEMALIRAAQDEYGRALRARRVPADLVVRHHAHRTPDPKDRFTVSCGVTVAMVPCWQLSTQHAACRYGDPDIGALLWWPETMRLERLLYAQTTAA